MSVPASANEKKLPGGHYSGRNPVPNIQRFIESLDADKKRRDAHLEADTKANQGNGEIKDHAPGQPKGVKGTLKTVTDPTTGKQVQIEDVDANFMKSVEQPVVRSRSSYSISKSLFMLMILAQLSVPNANLGKDTVRLSQL